MKKYLELLKHTQRMRDVYPLTHALLSQYPHDHGRQVQLLRELEDKLVVVAEPGSYWHNKGRQQILEHFEYVIYNCYH